MAGVPKYMTLVHWVKDKVSRRELLPGDKLSSENELSLQFDMSRQTVRHGISILAREGIIQRRQGSGNYISDYIPQNKRDGVKTIAIVSTYINAYIFPNIIEGMERVLSEAGYSVQIAFTHNKVELEYKVIQRILQQDNVAGLIVEPTKSGIPNPNISLYNQMIEDKIPAIFFNSYYPNVGLPHVSLDDESAGYNSTKYLVDAGHENIAAIFKSDDGQGHRRYSGYVKALLEAGIKIKDENVLWIDTEDQKSMSVNEKRILKRMKNCTACLCYNDTVGKSVEDLCQKHKIKVPKDLSIVSIDNSELAALCEVPLTSVIHPMDKLGEKAAKKLLRIIEDYRDNGSYEFEAKIFERDSVRKIENPPLG